MGKFGSERVNESITVNEENDTIWSAVALSKTSEWWCSFVWCSNLFSRVKGKYKFEIFADLINWAHKSWVASMNLNIACQCNL